MRIGASHRTAIRENMAVIKMTSATSLKIEVHPRQNTKPTTMIPSKGRYTNRGSGFRALAGQLREVRWPTKFKACHIDRYDDSSNPEEFIQVYQTVIEAAGGDDRVKANFLPTALPRAARSCLVNLPEGSIHSWDQLCAMLIRNFQGTYERPSTAKTVTPGPSAGDTPKMPVAK
jgi:hypothetical protein